MATSPLLNIGTTAARFTSLSQMEGRRLGLRRTCPLLCCHDFQSKENSGTYARSEETFIEIKRREALTFLSLTAAFSGQQLCDKKVAAGAGLPPEESAKLCDAACEKELENIPTVTTESGLQYKDIKIGKGPSPPIGFQVAANYVAMIPSGKVFDSSLDKGLPYIFRVGAGQVIKGLDEGILSMKVGGRRRLYIPGPLAFPKGLSAAAGRPRVLPSSPVVFDVSLEYVPGLDDEE